MARRSSCMGVCMYVCMYVSIVVRSIRTLFGLLEIESFAVLGVLHHVRRMCYTIDSVDLLLATQGYPQCYIPEMPKEPAASGRFCKARRNNDVYL